MENQIFITETEAFSPYSLPNDFLLDGGGILSSDLFVGIFILGWFLYVWTAHTPWHNWEQKLLFFLKKKHIFSFSPNAHRHKYYRYLFF